VGLRRWLLYLNSTKRLSRHLQLLADELTRPIRYPLCLFLLPLTQAKRDLRITFNTAVLRQHPSKIKHSTARIKTRLYPCDQRYKPRFALQTGYDPPPDR
jgi:hypothetical protein